MTSTLLRPAHLTLDELTGLVAHTAADPNRWQPYLQLPDGADRWWTRLGSDGRVDLWLLSWLPGHTTELHDHGDSAAAFTVVQGELAEVRAHRPSGRLTHFTWRPGPATWIAPGVLHDVTGSGAGPAVSIHAYSPPLTSMTYYGDGLRPVRTVQTDHPEEELHR